MKTPVSSMPSDAGPATIGSSTRLRCGAVEVVETCRSLGLTLAEIGDLGESYRARPGSNIGPDLAAPLQAVRERTHVRIEELQYVLRPLEAFETENRDELHGEADVGGLIRGSPGALDPPSGGNCSSLALRTVRWKMKQ